LQQARHAPNLELALDLNVQPRYSFLMRIVFEPCRTFWNQITEMPRAFANQRIEAFHHHT
jgi:hypothetical protein